MRLFPFAGKGNNKELEEEYNSQTLNEMESVRDFVILHYKLTQRSDSEYWNDYRTMDVPDSLSHRLEIFRKHGYASSDGLFHVPSWVQVMLGQGLYPERHHRASGILPPAGLKEQMTKIKNHIDMSLQQMPSHEDFIKQYCAAPSQAVK
jgi:tryptophan halogenase